MKHLKYIIVFFIILTFAFIACHTIFQKAERKIPLFNDNPIYFGDTPNAVQKKIGEPSRVMPDVSDTNKTAYEFTATILNNDASVICYFADDKRLVEVTIHWYLTDKASAEALFLKAETLLTNTYGSEKYFFENEQTISDDGMLRTSIGVFDGAEGVTYTLKLLHEEVIVICSEEK